MSLAKYLLSASQPPAVTANRAIVAQYGADNRTNFYLLDIGNKADISSIDSAGTTQIFFNASGVAVHPDHEVAIAAQVNSWQYADLTGDTIVSVTAGTAWSGNFSGDWTANNVVRGPVFVGEFPNDPGTVYLVAHDSSADAITWLNWSTDTAPVWDARHVDATYLSDVVCISVDIENEVIAAVTASGTSRLSLFDVSAWPTVSLLGAVTLPAGGESVAIHYTDQVACVLTGTAFETYDISTPATPVLLDRIGDTASSYTPKWSDGLSQNGKNQPIFIDQERRIALAFIGGSGGSGFNAVATIDISDPSNIVELGIFTFPFIGGFSVQYDPGSKCIIVASKGTLYTYDVTDASNIYLLDSFVYFSTTQTDTAIDIYTI